MYLIAGQKLQIVILLDINNFIITIVMIYCNEVIILGIFVIHTILPPEAL